MSSLPSLRPAAASRPRRRLRWLWWSLGVLLVLAVAGTFGVAVLVGWNLTHPARKPLTETPAQYGLAYTDISFPSREDHLNLKGWYLPAAGSASDKTVIIAHGFQGNRQETGPNALNVAKVLTGAGYNALLFDFRDSGESEGDTVTVGGREVQDLAGAVDYARSHGARKVALLGYSMGGSTALLAGERLPEVDAVVADSPFSALGPFVLENAKHWTHLPDIPFSYVIYWTIPKMLGFDLSRISPISEMPALASRPLLLIHGTGDDAISYHHSEMLMQAYTAAGGKQGQLWLVPGANHVKSFKVQPKEYADRLLSFLSGSLR